MKPDHVIFCDPESCRPEPKSALLRKMRFHLADCESSGSVASEDRAFEAGNSALIAGE
jgi:hypothetical protein